MKELFMAASDKKGFINLTCPAVGFVHKIRSAMETLPEGGYQILIVSEDDESAVHPIAPDPEEK